MRRSLLSTCRGALLAVALATAALCNQAWAAPVRVGALPQMADAAIVPAADSLGGLDEIFHMEPERLLFLGGGIVTGLLFVSPGLGVSELFGVVLGVIGGEYLYHTIYRRNSLF